MKDQLVIKAEVLSVQVLQQNHSHSIIFTCAGLPGLSTITENLNNIDIINFTAVYDGPQKDNYLSNVIAGNCYTFAGEKLYKEDGSWQLLVKNIVK